MMQFIKDIFLPTSFHGSYIFSQRIAAFDVSPTAVRAILTVHYRTACTITHHSEEPYDATVEGSLVAALQQVAAALGPCDEIRVALTGHKIIYKNVRFPFSDYKKIRMILPFELEQALPFSIQETTIDAIVTQSTPSGESDIIALALRTPFLLEYIDPFIQAGIHPTKVTVGAMEVAGMYTKHLLAAPSPTQTIESVDSSHNTTILIDTDEESLAIMIIANGLLKAVRVVVLPPEHAEILAVKEDSADKKIFFNRQGAELRFTITALLQERAITTDIQKILISGNWAEDSTIVQAVAAQLHPMQENILVDVLAFSDTINGGATLQNSLSTLPERFTRVAATAISSPLMENFNIGSMYRQDHDIAQIKKTIIVSVSLIALLFASFITYSIYTIGNLSASVQSAQKDTVDKLVNEFNLPQYKGKSRELKRVVSAAETALMQEENIWENLSNRRRFAFLRYLQELSTHIDREKLGLTIRLLTLKTSEGGEDSLIIDGAVKDGDYNALRDFERALKESKLFSTHPSLQQTQFNNLSLLFAPTAQGG